MHDECKWQVSSSEDEAGEQECSDWSHLVKNSSRKVESRSAGLQEDSPIARIFGGVMRSIVRSRGAKADSASLEPFNHLLLDISLHDVSSVWTALEVHCGPESVNEGVATRRLQFESLPRVLILNLKRFAYHLDRRGMGRAQKIKKPISFGEKLVLDRKWLTDGLESPEYIITAVICHHGDSVHGGHYNAAVRYNAEWYWYDDAIVRKMDVREVAAQRDSAYLLVYQHQATLELRP
jgi:ubiquitin carboxyl-terminal hydrolase 10